MTASFAPHEMARILLTTSCRATDALPKAPGAGQVVDGVQTMYNGVRVEQDGYCGPWMTEVIRRLDGHHEPQEELVFEAALDRLEASGASSPTMLELGSYWAFYSLSVLNRFPDGHAYLVEPDHEWIDVGRRNFVLNGRTGTFHSAAVGAVATPPQPFVCERDGVVRDIPNESLPSLMDRFGLSSVDILLADIQGFEADLLTGGSEIFTAGQVRFLFLSTHHHSISGDAGMHHRCLDLVRSFGGHVVAEHTVAESFSGDGLVVASFDPRDADFTVAIPYARAGDSVFGDPDLELAAAHRELAALRASVGGPASEDAPRGPAPKRRWRR